MFSNSIVNCNISNLPLSIDGTLIFLADPRVGTWSEKGALYYSSVRNNGIFFRQYNNIINRLTIQSTIPFFIGFIQARINLNAGTDPWVG
jgi:hypothetical protein